jgi:hypothetical protein
MKNSDLVYKLGIKWGLLITAGLVIFFFFMKMIGLVHNLELRALNILIVAFGVVAALKELKRKDNEKRLSYMSGFGCGLWTTAVGVVSFAVLVIFYLSFIDTAFMADIKQSEPFAQYLNPFTIFLTIVIEGVFSGILITYAALQFMKESLLKQSRAGKQVPPLGTGAPVSTVKP